MIFEPFQIKNLHFKNRVLRSSIGGRTSFYDGTVSSAFKNFEKRFAKNDVAGIISATISVNDKRTSPMEYPKISDDRFIKPFSEAIKGVQQYDCRYIVQIGDTGGHTHTSLFSQKEDAKSSSTMFDFFYGYMNLLHEMTQEDIEKTIFEFSEAGRRVREAGADALEITASKGYLIHQFLNPGVNRRKDKYGGSLDNRFRLLEEIIIATRKKVGEDFPIGIRLSSGDYNYLPVNIRLPLRFPLKDWYFGDTIDEKLYYAKKLKALGINYLHIDKGFGFPNPKGNPGKFPLHEMKMFYNSNSHLSFKAWARAALFNLIPEFILSPVANIGWEYSAGISASDAKRFKDETGLPVIANGGFQEKDLIENTLTQGKADMVAMARPFLANVDLLKTFMEGKNKPDNPCTHCNRCFVRTANFPLGCYDPVRFKSIDEMEAQIMDWSATSDESLEQDKFN
ncbi:MAG TPA: NADH:flavin oxidoreductase [Ignavibacteria bacterium]|nr:NADH:flavin oxidoreductase [Ignavibacteria bacterium]